MQKNPTPRFSRVQVRPWKNLKLLRNAPQRAPVEQYFIKSKSSSDAEFVDEYIYVVSRVDDFTKYVSGLNR